MIIVTGAHRTGTSLMMKTLLDHGFNIMEYNSVPIVYENIEMRGLCRVPKDPKNVAKCFGIEIERVNPIENVDGIIVCTRDPMESFHSYMRWRRPMQISGYLDRKCLMQYTGVQTFVETHPNIPYIAVDFSDWTEDEQAVCRKLEKFLEIPSITSTWNPESNEMLNSRKVHVIPNEPRYMVVEDQSTIERIKEIQRQLKEGASI